MWLSMSTVEEGEKGVTVSVHGGGGGEGRDCRCPVWNGEWKR